MNDSNQKPILSPTFTDDDQKQKPLESYFQRVNIITFEHNRCHEPQLAVAFVGGHRLFEDLQQHHRHEVLDLLLDIWDVYDPIDLRWNCGYHISSIL